MKADLSSADERARLARIFEQIIRETRSVEERHEEARA